MLSPEYYEGCADDIIELYEQLEDDIISDVVRRIVKTGKVTETAKHQIEQLQESGILYDDILKTIAKNTNATSQHVKALFEDAGVETVSIDNEVYRKNGLTPVDIRQSPAMRQTLEAGYKKTLGNMKNLTMTTANTSQTAYINACNQAYMQVSSGAFSYQEAIKNAVQTAAQNGATVLYPSGHTERIDVAVSRAVLTGVGQTCREIGIMNAEECGCDLMEISAHSGARPDHAKWQGQLVSLSGKNAGRTISGKKVLTLRQIGYGQGDGFGGWNCRHDWYPFFEGISKPAYTVKELEKLDERKIMYNGKMYNEYEISQIQRRYEREIRSAKREQSAFKVAVSEADDPELKQVMQDSLNYANSLVKDKQAKMRDFIKQTGQDRDYFREQNYPKENQRNSLTSPSNSSLENDFSNKFRRNAKSKLTNNKVMAFEQLPENLKSSFKNGLKQSEEKTAKILTAVFEDADFTLQDSKSFYNPIGNIISLRKDCPAGTIAHETFHYIDHRYKVNRKHNLFTPLQKDWANILKASHGDVIGYFQEKYPYAFEYSHNGKLIFKDKYRGISDIISGLSKDQINFGFHHKKEYWENSGKLQAESWAQFGRIYYENNPEAREMFSELFTNYEKDAIICLEEVLSYVER